MGRNYLTASIVKAPGNNTGGYSNAEIDALWEKATGATDEATARGHYSRIQQILSDELPIIPIMENDDRLVVDSRVTGLDKGPLAAYTEWDEARFT
jgi:ABC-type transport system substrate-binding protein